MNYNTISIKVYLEYEKEYRRFCVNDAITVADFVQHLELYLIPSYSILMHHYFVYYQIENNEWNLLYNSQDFFQTNNWEQALQFAKAKNQDHLYISISGVSHEVFFRKNHNTKNGKRNSCSKLSRCLNLHIDIPNVKSRVEAKRIGLPPFTPS